MLGRRFTSAPEYHPASGESNYEAAELATVGCTTQRAFASFARRMSEPRAIDLSVVLPVLNERENVERLLPRTIGVLRAIGCRYELVVVDGGSSDGTADAATAAG